MRTKEEFIGKHVVVRSSPSGVWLGTLQEVEGSTVTLENARRAWAWNGAASCSGLAVQGPAGGKFPSPIELARVFEVCEILLATSEAVARWEAIPTWQE